jgi:hypothetical protein
VTSAGGRQVMFDTRSSSDRDAPGTTAMFMRQRTTSLLYFASAVCGADTALRVTGPAADLAIRKRDGVRS